MSADLVSTRVVVNPQVRLGQPIIRGARITVWDILGWLGGGLTEPKILADYPELAPADIQAAFAVRLSAQRQSNAVKLLFDANISRRIVPLLEDLFPNPTHITHAGLSGLKNKST